MLNSTVDICSTQSASTLPEHSLGASLPLTWAETVQGHDYVALNDEDRDLLAQAIFELSSPELFGFIDQISSEWQAKHR